MARSPVFAPWQYSKIHGEVLGTDGRPVAYVAASRMDFDDVETTGGGTAARIGTLAARAPELLAALRLAREEIHHPGSAAANEIAIDDLIADALHGLPWEAA